MVLMFENRSFDNLLGALYPPTERADFDGVLGKTLSNPIPSGVPDAARGTVPFHRATLLDTPDPDPGEEHPHTNTQLFGVVDPPENAQLGADDMHAPYNAPAAGNLPTMDGFVADYIHNYRVTMGRLPRYDEYAQIMTGFIPEQLPVVSSLARGFACFDRWFCEVPSQTYPNRSFFHAATSSGYVVNHPVENFTLRNDAETIFDRLEAARLSWKVYFDPLQVVSATGLIHARRLARHFATHFFAHEDFYEDAAHGNLPVYSFLEPSMLPPHSDMHPPGAGRLRRWLPFLPRPAAIRGGEALLARVYESVRTSATETGSNYANTFLLVTFDEHGGTYDHVPPPTVPPPDPAAPVGQLGFRFDRSGVRVPTIAISAWIDPKTVVHEEFRATSVIRTLRERWGLGAPLTGRDAVAADLAPLLTRATPRPPDEWPKLDQYSTSPEWRLLERLDRLLPERGQNLVLAALSLDQVPGSGSPAEVGRRLTLGAGRRALRRAQAASFPQATRSRGAGRGSAR